MKQNRYLSFTQKAALKRFFTNDKPVLSSLLKELFTITNEVSNVFVADTGREEIVACPLQTPVCVVDAGKEGIFASLGQLFGLKNLPDIDRVILDMLEKLNSKENYGIQLQVAMNERKDFSRNKEGDCLPLHNYDPKQKQLKDPNKITPTHSLIFALFTVFEETQDYVNELQLRFSEYPDRDAKLGFRVVIVEVNKFNKDCSELITMQDRWLYIMKHAADLTAEQVALLSQDEETKMALEHLEKTSKELSSD